MYMEVHNIRHSVRCGLRMERARRSAECTLSARSTIREKFLVIQAALVFRSKVEDWTSATGQIHISSGMHFILLYGQTFGHSTWGPAQTIII